MRRAFFLLPALLACSSKDLVTAAAFPAEFGKAVCQVQSPCRGEAGYLEQQCEDEASSVYAGDLAKAIAAGRATFDAQQAQACLDGLHARKCGRTPPEVDQACERAVRGTVAAGGSCEWLFECASGRCEPESAGSCPAKCITAAGVGQSCNAGPCDLRAGLRCIDNVCSQLHTVDQKCSSSTDCAIDLYCDGFNKCSVRAFEQASCQTDEECADGLFCDASAEGGLCRKKIAQGASCTAASAQSIAGACVDGSVCKGFSSTKTATTPGTCTALGDVGAACVASAQVTGCADGLLCASGKCAEKPVSGPCTQDDDCKEGFAYCDGAACQLLKNDGVACVASNECDSHFCDPDQAKCVDNSPACHEP
jgi:hypothetical protein